MTSQPIVRLENISKTYQSGGLPVIALDKVDMPIMRGNFLAFCGPSGSGKTTLLNIIGALDLPSNGEVFIEDHRLKKMSQSELSHLRLHRIGFIFQAYNLIPVMTAYENAEFTMALQKVPKKERREIVMQALKDVGLSGLEDRRPNQLSGGQQQRVAIARAIAPKPAIVLADEPTANLDSKTAISLLDLMQDLNAKKGVTFIFSTHDNRVMERAKTIVHLRDGKVVDVTNRSN